MCGRLALFSDPTAVARHFGVTVAPSLAPRWNVAPRQPLCIVRTTADGPGREAIEVEWGLLPAWADPEHAGPRPINARVETAASKPMFRDAWRRRRCLVPADGWYEWTAGKGGRDPWFFALPDAGLLGLAGLWASWRGPDGARRDSATILTRPACAHLASLHDRMPLVIDPGDYAAWLAASDPFDLDDDRGHQVRARRVSRRVNSPAHDGPELLDAPAEPTP
jgi:putative SOS response-associated peptidase YedK